MVHTSEVHKMNFIKVINPEVRDKLAALGFSYVTENIGEGMIYSFADSPELREQLAKNYSKKDYFVSNKLCF